MARTTRSRAKSGSDQPADTDAVVHDEGTTPSTVEPAPGPVVAEPDFPVDPPADAEPDAVMAGAEEIAPETPEAIAEPPQETEVTMPPLAPRKPEEPRSVGLGAIALSALVSGAVGVGAALVFLPYGLQGGAPAQPDTSLAQRIEALESQPAAPIDTLESRLTALEAAAPVAIDLSPLDARVSALESAAPPMIDLGPVETRLNALESAPPGLDAAALGTALSPLQDRIARLEASIAASIDTQARAAVETALAEARAEADQQTAALSAQQAQIAEAEARLTRQVALAELTAAAESGVPAARALAALGDAPAALAPFADGLVTLTMLQDNFAPAARAALAAEPPPEDASLTDRVTGFLRAQTGARSLAPRDGSDTDAVLSRAEAALRQGDLDATLDELTALTGAPAAAMADWVAQAYTRQAAMAALTTLNGG